ncbi:DUF1062 domain-containing protein [Roseibium sp. LAB1]
MSSLLTVEWIVARSGPPKIERPCQRCGIVRLFGSTGKFRLNANGSQLDAWLVYRCDDCGSRWNRAFFERRAVGSLSPVELESLQRNDAALANAFACDLSGVTGGEAAKGFSLNHRLVSGVYSDADMAMLRLLNPNQVDVRLDRVLAKGLGLSRNHVFQLVEHRALKIQSSFAKALKKQVPEQVIVELHRHPGMETVNLFDRLIDTGICSRPEPTSGTM